MQTPPLSAEARSDLLQQPITSVLATRNADDTLRMTPLTFEAQDDGTIKFNTFENSAAVKNLRRDPRCSVLVDATDPSDADVMDPGYGVHYWGTATVEGPNNDIQGMGEMFARYMGGNEENARGYAEILVSYGDRLYLKFTPDRDVAWDYRMG